MPQEKKEATPPTPEVRAMKERLEKVRKEKEDLSLHAWHQRLKDREGFDWSYEGIRLYHRVDHQREPPASYLVHVSRAFNVELEYLLTGEGEVSRLAGIESQEREEVRLLREGAAWFFSAADQFLALRFLEVWEALLSSVWDSATAEEKAEVGVLLLDRIEWFLMPFAHDEDDLLEEWFGVYHRAVDLLEAVLHHGPSQVSIEGLLLQLRDQYPTTTPTEEQEA